MKVTTMSTVVYGRNVTFTATVTANPAVAARRPAR